MGKEVEQLKALTKRKAIISEYFKNGFVAASAWQKYYPEAKRSAATKGFSRILEDPEMREYMAKLAQANDVKNGLHQAHIIENLLKVYESAMEGDPIVQMGEDTGFKRKDRGAALKALELLGKHLGMFVETHQHLTINYNNVEVEFVD